MKPFLYENGYRRTQGDSFHAQTWGAKQNSQCRPHIRPPPPPRAKTASAMLANVLALLCKTPHSTASVHGAPPLFLEIVVCGSCLTGLTSSARKIDRSASGMRPRGRKTHPTSLLLTGNPHTSGISPLVSPPPIPARRYCKTGPVGLGPCTFETRDLSSLHHDS
jgi:hypothetical protein